MPRNTPSSRLTLGAPPDWWELMKSPCRKGSQHVFRMQSPGLGEAKAPRGPSSLLQKHRDGPGQ